MEILELPPESLERAIPNVSAHALIRLVSAYPRSAGRDLLGMIARCMSEPTMAFFREELNASRPPPTYAQIREAEKELMKAIREEPDSAHYRQAA